MSQLELYEVQCPHCSKVHEKELCRVGFREGTYKGEWWWEATYWCHNCNREWVEEDCSI